jgi:cation diffusion facilitator family transporter
MSNERREFEFPDDLIPLQRKAVRLEYLTIVYLLSAVVLLALTLGQSQAMKAAWVEDMLSLLPPVAFLVAARVRKRPANERFPWGYHRAISIGYAAGALALLAVGSLVFVDSLLKLVRAEHPPIGLIELFGQQVWLGWVMLGALAWSAFPAVLLGRAKLKLANELHDKLLYADAGINRADWMTAGAAMLGVIGIGLGLWWADAVAALFISLDIVRDGWKNVRAATWDLMDARPRRYDGARVHPLMEAIETELDRCDWVDAGAVRLREEGHVFCGEVLVVPKTEERLVERLEDLSDRLLSHDWKLYDLVVVPVDHIEVPAPGAERKQEEGRPGIAHDDSRSGTGHNG